MAEGTGLGNINTPIINMNDANVANNPNDKASGEEYFDRRSRGQDEQQNIPNYNFVDRSAQLRATLNSLASLNVVNVIQAKDKYKIKKEKDKEIKDKENLVSNPISDIEENEDEKDK